MLCKNCGGWNRDDENFCRSCLQRLTPGEGASASASVFAGDYAGFWERFAALILDSIVLCIISVPALVGLFLGGKMMGLADSPAYMIVSNVAPWLISAAYFILMESGEEGATYGKRWLKIRVADTDGNPIGGGRALGRYVAHALSYITLLIGYLIQPFTSEKQALHDMVSGTVVVKTEEGSSTLAIVIAVLAAFLGIIAVLGIVAAVAIPAYQDYVVKAKVYGAVQYGAAASKAVAEYSAQTGRIPVSISDTKMPVLRPPYISDVEIDPKNGTIQVVFATANMPRTIAGRVLTFEPSRSEGGRTGWKCSGDDIPPKLLPQTCR